MKTYDKFLDYYDQIVRGINSPIDEETDFLENEVIKVYNPEAKDVLEVACGTGIVAKELIKLGYNYTGLDINEKMLEKAKQNLKNLEKRLILGDMTNFNLNQKFDIVLCNYNSICHLLDWKSWQDFFEMAEKHLKKGGILVFDINTIFEFENITRDFAQFYNFGKNTVCLEMFKKGKIYEWLIKIFEIDKDGKYILTEENVREISFPISKIEKELKSKNFEILEKIDFHYGEVMKESERVYFICKKI
ncbi:class I SAM-dependent methyltransferase [Candidatus Gracilibacteria bacterium]|nr:MAG: class I SAM-dependent methyltransferase [Candidatus Gracilibacteria bacterium]